MNKNSIYVVVLLTGIWIILCENISVQTVATGAVVSIACACFCYKYLPVYKITGVNFLKLVIYAFYLIGQIYLSGFSAMKIILTNEAVDIVKVKTQIKNEFLRVVLANSITLTPGTVSLELQDDTITVLWLRKKSEVSQHTGDAGDLIKGSLERALLKTRK